MTDVFSKMTATENLTGKGDPWNLENGALEDWDWIIEAALATASTSKNFIDLSTKTDDKTAGVNQENNGVNKEVNTKNDRVATITPGVIRHTSQPDISLAYYYCYRGVSKDH